MSNKFLFLRVLGLLWVLAGGGVNAEPSDFAIELQPFRNYGYSLGDQLHLSVLIKTPMFASLERNQLPDLGFVNSWLNLKTIDISTDVDEYDYRVEIVYQLFKGVKKNQQLAIPAMPLSFKQARGGAELMVPEVIISYHPVSAVALDDQLEVQPEVVAPLIDNSHRPVSITLALIAVVLLYIAWFYGKIPLLRGYAGEFGKACKTLARLKRQPIDETVYKQALQSFHRAINTVNGATLFQHQLSVFFNEHKALQPLQTQTEALFDVSRKLFFTEAAFDPETLSLADIEQLCLQFRKLERGGRWS